MDDADLKHVYVQMLKACNTHSHRENISLQLYLKDAYRQNVWYTEEDSMSTSTNNRKSWLFYTQNSENSKYVFASSPHLSNWEYTVHPLVLKTS